MLKYHITNVVYLQNCIVHNHIDQYMTSGWAQAKIINKKQLFGRFTLPKKKRRRRKYSMLSRLPNPKNKGKHPLPKEKAATPLQPVDNST